jgi:hypothetical protein
MKSLFAAFIGMIVLFISATCEAYSLATRIDRMLEKYYRVGKFSFGSSQAGKPAHQAPQ